MNRVDDDAFLSLSCCDVLKSKCRIICCGRYDCMLPLIDAVVVEGDAAVVAGGAAVGDDDAAVVADNDALVVVVYAERGVAVVVELFMPSGGNENNWLSKWL